MFSVPVQNSRPSLDILNALQEYDEFMALLHKPKKTTKYMREAVALHHRMVGSK